MSRNFQTKIVLNARVAQNPIGNSDSNIWVRVYIIYPRKFSNVEAINYINNINFPLLGMCDQDNWIIWYDKWFMLSSNQQINNLTPKTKRIVFNKRFYSRMLFANSSANQPEKGPFMIIVTDHSITANTITVQGYSKLSYKDV